MAQSPYFYGGNTAPVGSPKPKPKPVNKPAAVKPPVKPKPVPVKVPSGTSAAQQIVNAALAPLLSSIQSQEAVLKARQAAQQSALRAFSAQVLDYLKGAPAAIQADYQGAVDSTRNLAQASADELLKANPNSLNQADLAAINAPQAQRDALAAQNQNVYGGGAAVLNHTAGIIPATAFAADKANASAFANSLPSIQGLQAQQLFAQLLGTQGKETSDLAAQRAEVVAKAPALLLDAQKQLAANTAGPAVSTKAPTVRRIGSAYYEWNPGKGWVKLAEVASADKRGQVKLSNGQYVTTLNGQPVGNAWGPVKAVTAKGGSGSKSTKLYGNSTAGYFTMKNGKLTPVPGYTPKKGANGKPVSGSTVSIVVARANAAGTKALDDVKAKIWANTPGGGGDPPDPEDKYYKDYPDEYDKDLAVYEAASREADKRLALNFGTAMYRVIAAVSPHLRAIGYTPAQVKAAAFQMVTTQIDPPHGYKL